jgi:hypothetical protein
MRHVSRFFANSLDLAAVQADHNRFHLTNDDVELLEELDKLRYLRTIDSFDIPISVSSHPVARVNFLSQLELERKAAGTDYWPEIGAVLEIGKQDLEIFELANIDVNAIGTHLGCLRREEAIGLLARGYLNTFLSTWELKPLGDDEIRALADLPQRFRRMVQRPASQLDSAAISLV